MDFTLVHVNPAMHTSITADVSWDASISPT